MKAVASGAVNVVTGVTAGVSKAIGMPSASSNLQGRLTNEAAQYQKKVDNL